MRYEEYGIVGEELNNIRVINIHGYDSVDYEYNDGSHKSVKLPERKKNAKIEISKALRFAHPGLSDNEIKESQGKTWHAYVAKNNAKKAGLAAGMVALGLGVGATSMGLYDRFGKKEEPKQEPTTVTEIPVAKAPEFVSKVDNGLDITGLTWDEIHELLEKNKLNKTQADFIRKVTNWLETVNVSEDWEEKTLTDEEVEEANELLGSLELPELEGNVVRFGFTTEEAISLALRFGNYTEDEIITLVGGNKIDVEKLMNESSNDALRKIMIYLLCTEKADLKIENLVNFNEKEVEEINELNTLLNEFKELDAKEVKTTKEKNQKNKDKEAKMLELRDEIVDYTLGSEDTNGVAYILRTYLVAAEIISDMNHYDKVETSITLLNTKTDKTEEKTIKTKMFNDYTMARLVLGTDGFDMNGFKKANKIGSNYELVAIDQNARSAADMSCGSQKERLEQANQTIFEIRLEDLKLEEVLAIEKSIDLSKYGVIDELDNVKTRYDKLTDNTIGAYDFAPAFDVKLEEDGLRPMNMQYFEHVYLAKTAHEMEAKVNPRIGGKPGDVIVEQKQEHVEIGTGPVAAETLDKAGYAEQREAAEEKWAEQATKETGIPTYDANTKEEYDAAVKDAEQKAKAVEASLQTVYNETYEFFYSGDKNGYDPSWETSSDANVRTTWAMAKSDALNEKAIDGQVGKESGGEITYYDLGEGKSYPSVPADAPATTTETTTTIINENSKEVQDAIDAHMAAVEKENQSKIAESNNSIISESTGNTEYYDIPNGISYPSEDTTSLNEGLSNAGISGSDISWMEGFDGDIEIEGDVEVITR